MSRTDPLRVVRQQLEHWKEQAQDSANLPDYHLYNPARLYEIAENELHQLDSDQLADFDLAFMRAFGVSIRSIPATEYTAESTVKKMIADAQASAEKEVRTFPHKPDTMITRQEAARLTGLSVATIDRMVKRGEFVPAFKTRERRIGFKAGDVEAWIADTQIDRSVNRKRK